MERTKVIQKTKEKNVENKNIFVQFFSITDVPIEKQLQIPLNTSIETLTNLLHKLTDSEEKKYSFFYKNYEIQNNLKELLVEFKKNAITSEKTVKINFLEEESLDVKPVTRISSSLEGHEQAVLDIHFSPDSNYLASVSGDKTVRLWDVHTETPYMKLEGHKNWVMIVKWAPDSKSFVTSDLQGNIFNWKIDQIKENKKKLDKIIRENKAIGKKIDKLEEKKEINNLKQNIRSEKLKLWNFEFKGHKAFVTALDWRPYHIDSECQFFVSSSKDNTVRLWDAKFGKLIKSGLRHSKSVTKVLWSGEDYIYSISQDCNLIIWNNQLDCLNILSGHSHWINCISINTFHPLKTSFHDNNKQLAKNEQLDKLDNPQKAALLYKKTFDITQKEILITGSDDNTIIIWHPLEDVKKYKRLTGHIGPINHISFAPNSVLFVSASFDKTLRIWSIHSDVCLGILRAHVSEVYVLAFSRDSKWVVSGSRDSSLQVWNVKKKKRAYILPGHADEVYCVDWSPDGNKMGSGGKDKMVRIWSN
jgi:ribosome assembly protein 4